MSDPFASNSKSQLIREAKIGLSLVAILLILFVYVAYYRITGQGSQIPPHVRAAPVAQAVWPYEPKTELATEQTRQPATVTSQPKRRSIAGNNAGSKDWLSRDPIPENPRVIRDNAFLPASANQEATNLHQRLSHGCLTNGSNSARPEGSTFVAETSGRGLWQQQS